MTMRAFGLFYLALAAHGFPMIPQNFHRHSSVTVSNRRSTAHRIILRMSRGMDYEYIPPNPSAPAPYKTDFTSVYPPGTPAGLRGEAVRSALRSTRCLAWDLGGSPLESGWLSIEGKGTMDFLQNKFSQSFVGNDKDQFTQGCLLDAKGKVVDLVGIVVQSPTKKAYLWTSPGHKGSALYNRLDPLIFPMDKIKLKDCTASTRMISVASTRIEHVQRALRRYVQPLLMTGNNEEARLSFPSDDSSECITVSLADDSSLLILPSVGLPPCACVGYTLVFTDITASSTRLPDRVWSALVGDDNPDGPIELGPLEYETLRIEAGQPAFGKELTAATTNKKDSSTATPAGPLELHWQSYLDLDKGCYLGQEGVASVVKNPRGPPRLLYSVVFDDEDNIYQHQSEGEQSRDKVENLTTLPQPGQELFVLGSNEQISVGILTSIAEPSGTGEPATVGMALVKRADSIMKQMKDMNLELGPSSFRETEPPIDMSGSGIIQPPPLDPLDGLEVIVGGSFTVGKLKVIPSRRYRRGQNMFEDVEIYESQDEGTVMGYLQREPAAVDDQSTSTNDESEDEDLDKAMEEAAKAQAEAEAAAAEAKRKAEKMEMLKRRAEEAMARRKAKKQQ